MRILSMKNKKKVSVNDSVANIIYDQMMGQYSGHMANIPNNPTLMSICTASGVRDRETFKEFLQQVVDKLPDTDW